MVRVARATAENSFRVIRVSPLLLCPRPPQYTMEDEPVHWKKEILRGAQNDNLCEKPLPFFSGLMNERKEDSGTVPPGS